MTHTVLKFHNGAGGKFHNSALIQFHDVIEVTGGASGGRSTQKGVSVYDTDRSLGERPHRKIAGESIAKLKIRVESRSKSKLFIPLKSFSESVVKPLQGRGVSISRLLIPLRTESRGRMKLLQKNESYGYIHRGDILATAAKKMEKFYKLARLTLLYNLSESIDHIYEKHPRKKLTFSFNETVNDELLNAFTHSSSFIGNVQYDTETSLMRVIINGITYAYSDVPQRIFDAFEGAASKGAFFARAIREQFPFTIIG